MKKGEFKLARQINGRGHFAYVEVEAGRTQNEVDVTARIVAEDDWPFPHQDWIEQAILGARQCVNQLRTSGSHLGAQVHVLRIHGTYADTGDDDVRYAAYLATFRALLPDVQLPMSQLVGKIWKIDL